MIIQKLRSRIKKMKDKKDEEKYFLKWKLKEKPTTENVVELVNAHIITKEEARQIVLEKTEDIKMSDIESIKEEVKLLRKLVLELIDKKPSEVIVKIIEKNIINVPYKYNEWTTPYITYCSNNSTSNDLTGASTIGDGTTILKT